MKERINLKRRWRTLLASVAIIFGGVLLVAWLVPFAGESDVPLLDIAVTGEIVDDLKVRTAEDGNLLILPPRGYPTYQYNIKTGALEKAKALAWEMAQEQFIPSSVSIHVGTHGHKLNCTSPDGRNVSRTIDRTIVSLWQSPNEAGVVLLTTDGWERPVLRGIGWPIAGSIGGGYTGQHYLEFFRTPTLESTREPTRIPFTSAADFFGPVWAPDGRFVILASPKADRLVVIPTGLGDYD